MTHLDALKRLDDIHLLSLLIWGEARGENLVGKVAVAWVVLNRVHDARWPNTIQAVVLQPKQFSCFNENDPNFPQLLKLAKGRRTDNKDVIWRECQLTAFAVICGWVRDPTKGANHYHTRAVKPSWDKDMQLTTVIAEHNFYRA